jgi:hypothetical protein
MHPAVRALGTLLRLVGISSPEDTASRPSATGPQTGKPAAPPSWRSSSDPSQPAANPPAPTSSSASSAAPKDNPPSV